MTPLLAEVTVPTAVAFTPALVFRFVPEGSIQCICLSDYLHSETSTSSRRGSRVSRHPVSHHSPLLRADVQCCHFQSSLSSEQQTAYECFQLTLVSPHGTPQNS